jgi:hypothetical protein
VLQDEKEGLKSCAFARMFTITLQHLTTISFQHPNKLTLQHSQRFRHFSDLSNYHYISTKFFNLIYRHFSNMFFSKSTIAAFIVTITLSSASPLSSKRQEGPICETSGGSPNTVFVSDIINGLRGNSGDHCANDNDIASGKI